MASDKTSNALPSVLSLGISHSASPAKPGSPVSERQLFGEPMTVFFFVSFVSFVVHALGPRWMPIRARAL
jgi:uncharacterized membrane protein (DUF485 family)